MDRPPATAVFAGGGTLGHLMPGLAEAEVIRRELPQVAIVFAGPGGPLERRLVRRAGHEYLAIPCRPLTGGPWRRAAAAARLGLAYVAAYRWLGRRPASVVVGLGGYASLPMARAAVARGVPLVLLEQNARLGRANRWLARRAQRICCAFAEADEGLDAAIAQRIVVTGNPVLAPQSATTDPHHAAPSSPRDATDECLRRDTASRPLLLVLGGSSGAQDLNRHVPWALAKVDAIRTGWRILHQSGRDHAGATAERYRALGLSAAVLPFVDDLPALMRQADLAISRAGGTTLAELAAAGLPAVLCPYPYAAEDHQRLNAVVFAAAGGCRVVDMRDDRDSFASRLSAEIRKLVADHDLRRAMSEAMLRRARPTAADQIAGLIGELVAHSEKGHGMHLLSVSEGRGERFTSPSGRGRRQCFAEALSPGEGAFDRRLQH